jgi:toxin ParE1/3/4
VTTRRPRARKSDTPRAIFWTNRALDDLEAIGDYIARDDPAAAERWIGLLIAGVERAAGAPLSGRRVPEIGRDDVREVFERAYRIVYRVEEKRIVVLTLFEGHRLFPRGVG